MPSAQKWLAVTTTTRTVSTAWPAASHRHGLVLTATTTTPTRTAHATWIDGMAESWSAMPLPVGPYTDWP
jgi:hypothetical protein